MNNIRGIGKLYQGCERMSAVVMYSREGRHRDWMEKYVAGCDRTQGDKGHQYELVRLWHLSRVILCNGVYV